MTFAGILTLVGDFDICGLYRGVMRNKTRQFSRTQRILLSCKRETPAMMRAQTFSVCAKPQGARPAHTNFFFMTFFCNVPLN